VDILTNILNSRLVRILVLIKVLAIITLVVAIKGGLFIGERGSKAAEEEAPQESVAAPSKPDEEGYVDGDKKKAKRRSFLDELLEMPKINTENAQKDEIGRYLTIAERKMRQVEERIELLKEREKKLVDLEKSIDDKLRRLDEERRFFADTLQQEKDLKTERTAALVEFYKKMAPKKAAPVFEKLNKDLVVEMFKQLPQKQITGILELLPAEKSVELSEYYGRLRSGREYDVLKELNQSLKDEFQECKGMPAGKPAI